MVSGGVVAISRALRERIVERGLVAKGDRLAFAALAGPVKTGPVTLFENVRVFDGRSDSLSEPVHVLLRGNVIEASYRSSSTV